MHDKMILNQFFHFFMTPAKFLTKQIIRFLILFGFLLNLTSCATAPKRAVSFPPPYRKDVVHTVAPGETLWRISQMYSVPVATIMSANQLTDKNTLKMGQRIRVPRASPLKPVVPLYPSRKWRYIIIHHSATETGNSLTFHKSHLQKGWDRGVGYHFVIDNNQSGKQDGQIEVTPRWIKQEDGAHCKASDMNVKAIGICLVGNFSQEHVSRKQMDSLVYLVNKLRRYYNIPAPNILGHGQVPGANTECPGKNFPWSQFKRQVF